MAKDMEKRYENTEGNIQQVNECIMLCHTLGAQHFALDKDTTAVFQLQGGELIEVIIDTKDPNYGLLTQRPSSAKYGQLIRDGMFVVAQQLQKADYYALDRSTLLNDIINRKYTVDVSCIRWIKEDGTFVEDGGIFMECVVFSPTKKLLQVILFVVEKPKRYIVEIPYDRATFSLVQNDYVEGHSIPQGEAVTQAKSIQTIRIECGRPLLEGMGNMNSKTPEKLVKMGYGYVSLEEALRKLFSLPFLSLQSENYYPTPTLGIIPEGVLTQSDLIK